MGALILETGRSDLSGEPRSQAARREQKRTVTAEVRQ